MHFILKCTIDPAFLDKTFEKPITDRLFEDLDNEIINAFLQSADEFSLNLKNAGSAYSFERLISDAFDLLSKYAVGCLFIEKNQLDCANLVEHYKEYRKRFFGVMSQYIEIFIEKGAVRPLKHRELTVRLMIEILTWWAMDMRYISFEALDIPLEQAKEACLDNIITAYKQNH